MRGEREREGEGEREGSVRVRLAARLERRGKPRARSACSESTRADVKSAEPLSR